jgi:hypothetical protein
LDYLKNLKDNFVPKLVLKSGQEDDPNVITESGISYGDIKSREIAIENDGDGLLEFEISKQSKSPWL